MHDRLYRSALTWGLFWLVLASVLLAVIPALVLLYFGVVYAVLMIVLGTPVITVLLVLPHRLTSMSAVPRGDLMPATREMTNLVEGISIAWNQEPPIVRQLEHPSPNVAVLSGGFRKPKTLIVTSGLADTLTRDELEAFCAAQIAIANDRWCGRLVRARTTLGLLSVLVVAFELLRELDSDDGAIMLALVGMGAMGLVGALTCGFVDWWSKVLIDATCIKTTRNPAAYYRALRKVVLYNGDPVPVKSAWMAFFLMADACWAVTLQQRGIHLTTRKRAFRSDIRVRESVEMGNDIELLARAAMLRRGATMRQWRHVRKVIERAERAAVNFEPIDFQGMEVGPDGAHRKQRPPEVVDMIVKDA